MFIIEQSPYSNKFFIKPDGDLLDYFKGIDYLFLIAPRVLGMSYTDYLRFVRDKYGAKLRGKTGFPILEFDEKEDAQKLQKLLNRYWINGTKII